MPYQINGNNINDTREDMIRDIFNKKSQDTLDYLYSISSLGSKSDSIANHFYGINHRQTPTLIPHNTDQNGYAFFIRPRLNLTTGNIMTVRKLNNLLDDNPLSVGRFVRNTLDPVLAKKVSKYPCPLVDPNNVFIPLLSNSLIQMDPPPSTTVGSYSSGTPGVFKEVFTMIDDSVIDYSTYNINCTFRNTQGNPFLALFYSWMLYASLQYLDEGPIPYPDDLMNNRINYSSRIYRLIMDPSKKIVQSIWACIYCYPVSIETGSIFGYDEQKPIKDDLRTLSIQFNCMGNIFNDFLLIEQFNTSVTLLNGLMGDDKRKSEMIKIPQEYLIVYNNLGYPRINPDTYELEWWITKDQYNKRIQVKNLQDQIKEQKKDIKL
jgi:hypothetical protein